MCAVVNHALVVVPTQSSTDLTSTVLQAVTIDQVATAMKKYLLPVFDPVTSIAVVASAPGKVGEIATGLAEVGFHVEKRELDVDSDELAAAAEESEGSESESESDEGVVEVQLGR